MAKWYSTNEEDFTHMDIEDAISEAFDDESIVVGEIRSVWEGEGVVLKAGDYAPANFSDDLANGAYDECGEHAGDWPAETKEQELELRKMIAEAVNTWADKHGLQPTFGTVKDVREILVRMTSEEGGWEYVSVDPID